MYKVYREVDTGFINKKGRLILGKLLFLLETKNPVGKLRQGLNLEVTVRIELTKYGFANRPVSHSGTSPREEEQKLPAWQI